jgi:tellurite methyltransferase
MEIQALNRMLGNMDIYLLDQVLKGRFTMGMKLLDAGCGEGRNTHYFIREGFGIVGVDKDPMAIQMARSYAKTINPGFDPECFQVGRVEELFYQDEVFDGVFSSAVLHFAVNENQFCNMFSEMIRVLKKGGLLWVRACTDAGGTFTLGEPKANGRFLLPDGTERFIFTEALLEKLVGKFHLSWVEPPKSVLVHGKRAMGVYLLKKH